MTEILFLRVNKVKILKIKDNNKRLIKIYPKYNVFFSYKRLE